jgi:hypothetical protein
MVWLSWWVVLMGMVACVQIIVAVNEREQWSPRVGRTIPRSWWLRVPAFFLYSGSAGGVLYALLLFGLTLGTVALWRVVLPDGHFHLMGLHDPREPLAIVTEIVLVFVVYVYCYGLTAALIRKALPRRLPTTHTWAFLVFLAGMSALVSIVGFLYFARSWSFETHFYTLLGNPVGAAVAIGQGDPPEAARVSGGKGGVGAAEAIGAGKPHPRAVSWYFVGGWAIIATLLSLPWLIGQIVRFRCFLPTVMPPDAAQGSPIPVLVTAEPALDLPPPPPFAVKPGS